MVEMESNANGETAKPPKPVQAEEAKPTAKANAGEEEQKKDQPGVEEEINEGEPRQEADANVLEEALNRPINEASLDIIIVGAGIAGAALATKLAQSGRKVLLLERSLEEPDRIVGELLQPGGYLKLKELGLQDCLKGIDAQRVNGYAMFKGDDVAKVAYPLEEYDDDIAGRSFHNGRFVQQLRLAAAKEKNVCIRQATVTGLMEKAGSSPDKVRVTGVRYKDGESEESKEVHAPLTIVCDGCFSRLRKNMTSANVSVPSHFVGLVLKSSELPFKNYGHVILGNPSPVLFYPISSTEIRCLIDIPGNKIPNIRNGEMEKYLLEKIVPQVPAVLQPALTTAVREGKFKTMPNSTMPAKPIPTPGALLLGDAFNMRHPLTGGGMTVALSDVTVINELLEPLDSLRNLEAVGELLETFYLDRKPVASTINTLANALYKVFCASEDEAMEEMRQACFDYLKSGGNRSAGPVALLSGLDPSPSNLVMHFFSVAMFGVGRLLSPLPSLKGMLMSARILRGATGIITPIVWAEGIRQMFFPYLSITKYRHKRKFNAAKEKGETTCDPADADDSAEPDKKRAKRAV